MSFLDEINTSNRTLYQQVCVKISAIVNGAQEHSLNDGQIDQKVKNADLPELYKMKKSLENEIAEYEGDICGSSYIY